MGAYYLSIPLFGAHYAEVCSKGEYGPPDQCSSYDIVSALLGRAFVFADEHNGIVAAIAGSFVAAFTGILWWTTHKLWIASEKQFGLARDEFNANHRPWLSIRGATLGSAAIELGALEVEVTVEWALENTSEFPALDLLLYGVLVRRVNSAKIDEVVKMFVDHYEYMSRTGIPKDQNQVVFPHEVTTYKSAVAHSWRDIATKAEWSPVELGDLLVIAIFIYVNPINKADFKTSICVHRVTSVFDADDVKAARSGTNVLKDGHIGRWRTGWSAT